MSQASPVPPFPSDFPPTKIVFIVAGDIVFEVCRGQITWRAADKDLRPCPSPADEESRNVLRGWLEEALQVPKAVRG